MNTRTFDSKQNAHQRKMSSGPVKPRKNVSGLSPHSPSMSYWQRAMGNPAIEQLAQAKLKVGTAGDIYEQEADQVAEQVMRMPNSQIQRACICAGGCSRCVGENNVPQHVRMKRVQAENFSGTEVPSLVEQVFRSPGCPLDSEARHFLEPRFGQDFSQVRVHTDAIAAGSAQALNAQAYTVGRDVVFAAGSYSPETNQGRRLLAHELTHVVQQTGGLSLSNSKRSLQPPNQLGEALPQVQNHNPPAMGHVQRQPAQPLTAQARRIIAVAQRQGDLQHRAWQVVWEMLRDFFPGEIDVVHGVTFQESALGLPIELAESRDSAAIIVGRNFMEGVTEHGFQGSLNEMRLALERIEIRMRGPVRTSTTQPSATPPVQQSPQAMLLQQQIHQQFGITIRAGARPWALEDLRDLQQTLGRLNGAERTIVKRFTFIREGTKPSHIVRCGLTTVNRPQGIFHVQMWNECFGRPRVLANNIRASQVFQFGLPIGQSRIQHEIGHTIEFSQTNPQIEQEFNALIRQNRNLSANERIPANEPFFEAFAEAFGAFRTAPDRLRAANLPLFSWFQRGRHIRNVPPAP